MASRVRVHPWPYPENGPYFYGSWREEFNSRASWGKHPAASGPNREWNGGNCGPTPLQGFHKESHPGEEYDD